MNRKFAKLSWTGLLVLMLLMGITGVALAGEIHVKHASLDNHQGTCLGSGGTINLWHFIITDMTDATAPLTIHVIWNNGSELDVPLDDVHGGAAHYTTTDNAGYLVLDAIAYVPDGWDGQFNLSHVDCVSTPEATPPTVSKDASGSYDDTFEWTISKSADTPTVYSAGGGESNAVNYTVTVSHGDSQVGNVKVNGTINITNPDGAVIDSVTDELSDGTDCTVTGTSYECDLSNLPDGDLTNTVTITWSEQTIGGKHLAAGSDSFTTGAISFTATEIDTCVDVDDTLAGALGTVCVGEDNPTVFNYPMTFSDDEVGTCTPHDNVASFTTNDTETSGSSETVIVEDCQGADLTVEKTATPSFDLTYTWNIDKAVVGSSSATVDQGQPAIFNYSVTVSHDAGTESNWAVSGTITVSNPNDWQDIVADVSDSLPSGNCSVTGGDDVFVPRSDSVTLDYSCTFGSNPGSGTNTATATWDADAAHTPNGSASGDAGFVFGDPTNVIDECVDVTDSIAGFLGTVCVGDDNPTTFNYSSTFNGPAAGTCVDYPNTATSTTNDTGTQDSDSESVRVCSFKAALTPGYWKTHLALTGTSGCTGLPSGTGCSNNGPFTKTYLSKSLGNYNVDTILKAAQVWAAMNCSNTGSASAQNQNSMGCLAGHLLAAKMNVANGANTCIAPVIALADQFLKNPPLSSVTFGGYTANSINYTGPTGTYTGISTAQRNLAIALKNALDAYNNGIGCH